MVKYLYKTYSVCLFLLLLIVAKTNANTPYVKGAVVTEVKQNWEFNENSDFVRKQDTITVTLVGGKNDGHMYQIDTNKDTYHLNDIVEVNMTDNGTDNLFTDDCIKSIRKVGDK